MKNTTLKTTAFATIAAVAATTQHVAFADEVTATPATTTETTTAATTTEVTKPQLADAANQAQQADDAANKAQTDVDAAQKQNDTDKANVTAAQADVDKAQAIADEATPDKIAEVEAGIQAKSDELPSAEKTEADAKADLQAAKDAVELEATQAKSLEAEIKQDQSQLDDNTAKRDAAAKAQTDAVKAQQTAKDAITAADNAVDDAEKKVAQAQADEQKAAQADADKTQAINDAQADVTAKQKDLDTAKATQTTAKNDVTAKQSAVDKAQATVEWLNKSSHSVYTNTGYRIPITKEWLESVTASAIDGSIRPEGHNYSQEPLKKEYDNWRWYYTAGLEQGEDVIKPSRREAIERAKRERNAAGISEEDWNHKIDVRNLTDDELRNITEFYLNTMNGYAEDIEKLVANDPEYKNKIFPRFYASDTTLRISREFAQRVAEVYPDTTRTEHMGLSESTEKEYGISNHSEALAPSRVAYTMGSLKYQLNIAINMMLFRDGHSENGHARIILNPDRIHEQKDHRGQGWFSKGLTEEERIAPRYVVLTIAPTKISPVDFSFYINPVEAEGRNTRLYEGSFTSSKSDDTAAKLQEAKDALSAAQAQLTAAKQAQSAADTAVASAQNNLDQAKAKLNSLQAGTALADAKAKVAAAQKALTTAKAAQTKANTDLAVATQAEEDATRDFNVFRKAVDTQTAQLATKRQQLADLQASIATKTAAVNDAQAKYDAAAAKVAELKDGIAKAQALLATYKNADKLLADAKAKLAELIAAEEVSAQALADAKANLEEATKAAEEAKAHYNKLKAQYDAQQALNISSQNANRRNTGGQANTARPIGNKLTQPTGKSDTPSTLGAGVRQNADGSLSYSRVARSKALPNTGESHSVVASLSGLFLLLTGLSLHRKRKES
ncbi:SEC10/PgrA surface exclusion domain-containing protein [Streptococcus sp. ZJ100]|uniref:SEC10/PgrA surface exclusion domain-containing protein n=1 Tax=Streptococcus handemini TaxID=3161188 RepID=UPI0032EBCD82